MNTDSYYAIGASHVVCQDRTLHGKINDDCFYAVGSDGCSDRNSPRSELGATLLCELVRNQLEIHDGGFSVIPFKNVMLEEMRRLASTLRISHQTFDATLWLIHSFQGAISVTGWGDGVVHLKYKDGSSETNHIEFVSGMPLYLSYELDPARYETYKEQTASKKALIHHYENGELKESREFASGNFMYHDPVSMGKPELESVSVFSDGACTFSKNSLSLALPEIIKDLTDYKSTVGPFVARRMLKITPQHRKDGISHYDDLFCLTLAL